MAMTKLEKLAKREIITLLNEQGYHTYATLLSKFDVNLTKDPNVVAYMRVDKALIMLNMDIPREALSTIVRHEILHEYFTHFVRTQNWEKLSKKKLSPQANNIAADFDISNKGYTDSDKQIVKTLMINNKLMAGLVTDIDKPEYANMSFEEMLDAIADDNEAIQNQMQKSNNWNNDPDDSIQQAEQVAREAEAMSDEMDDNQEGDSSSNDSQQDGEQQDNTNDSDKSDDDLEDYGKPNKSDSNDTDNSDDSDDSDTQKELDKISDAAKQAADALKKTQNTDDNEVFKSKSDKKEEADLETRIKDIKKAFDDLKSSIQTETDNAIKQDKAKNAQAEVEKRLANLQKYNNTPIKRFSASLANFIKNATYAGRGLSWGRFSKKYANSGLIKPGIGRNSLTKIPTINVYYDRSGSWDATKTAQGDQVISTFKNYVKQGKLKINLFYFSNNVHTDEAAARAEGCTYGQPILNHIEQTKPDNVIIMTDSDISDCRGQVVVPGTVWLLFVMRGNRPDRSQNLIDNLKGKRTTQIFDIEV